MHYEYEWDGKRRWLPKPVLHGTSNKNKTKHQTQREKRKKKSTATTAAAAMRWRSSVRMLIVYTLCRALNISGGWTRANPTSSEPMKIDEWTNEKNEHWPISCMHIDLQINHTITSVAKHSESWSLSILTVPCALPDHPTKKKTKRYWYTWINAKKLTFSQQFESWQRESTIL